MDGPAGYGTQKFVADSASLPYQINFENDPSATAPAQRVDISDPLDPNLDWSTFQLAAVGFGSTYITIPAGLQYYDTTVSTTENGQTFNVVISLNLNPATGVFTASFQSIDPSTDLPPASLPTGFLPPKDGSGRGIGFFSFTVGPKTGLATGTQIRNVAQIAFDQGQTIATDQKNDEDPTQGINPTKQALVTIDATPPTSSVKRLPATEIPSSFTVSWSGSDPNGPGIASYSIFVTDNGGPFMPWLTDTTQTSATYTGQIGHTYGFYSVATDPLGLTQPTPTKAQATTYVVTNNFVVTNTSVDASTSGSLPWAVQQANAASGSELHPVRYSRLGSANHQLTSTLKINDQMVIDGTSQPGYKGTPLISIQGSADVPSLFTLGSGSSGSTIQGLDMYSYTAEAIDLTNSTRRKLIPKTTGSASTSILPADRFR